MSRRMVVAAGGSKLDLECGDETSVAQPRVRDFTHNCSLFAFSLSA